MHHLSDVRFEDPGTLRYVMRFLVHLGKNLLMPIYLWSATVPIIVALTAVGLSMTYLCAGVVTMPALSHAPCVIAVPASILIFWMVGLSVAVVVFAAVAFVSGGVLMGLAFGIISALMAVLAVAVGKR